MNCNSIAGQAKRKSIRKPPSEDDIRWYRSRLACRAVSLQTVARALGLTVEQARRWVGGE